MTGFYTFNPTIFDDCQFIQPSDRSEYEISDGINLLILSGQTIDAIGLDGWRIDISYPEEREEAERRLQQQNARQSEKQLEAGTD